MGRAEKDTPREDITRQLSFGVVYPDGRQERRTIYPVSEEDLGMYRRLGRGSAENPGVAIYMAFLHTRDFFERVAAYRLIACAEAEMLEHTLGKPFSSIEFFERA
jgi:hypothetical protein